MIHWLLTVLEFIMCICAGNAMPEKPMEVIFYLLAAIYFNIGKKELKK